MRIAVEVLCGEFKEFSIFECFHLVDQARRHVHALTCRHLEFVDYSRVGRILDADLKPSGAQIERFGLELMEMQ